MGFGDKGQLEITGSGTSPVSEYSLMADVLPDDFPVFDDGAGEVEEMLSGNWVSAGGPPWYYPFTEITLSEFDYFGFSLYLYFTNEVSSIGALAADGDYFLDLGNNRVYIYGYLGGAPAADGYLHACEDQLIIEGAGPLEMPEQTYPPGFAGIRKIGDLHNGTLKYTGIKNIHLHKLGNKVHAFGEGSRNDADYDQGETDRLGFFYSDDGGETWNWSSQWLYNEPITWQQPFPDPPEILDANDYDIPLGKTPINVGNATSYLTQTGEHGFMPMSADGTLMIYGVLGSSNETFFFTPDGGASWKKAAHTHTYAKKDSFDLPTPGDRFEPQGMCRDASVIVDPSPTTGKGWVFYILDRRGSPNNCITKVDLAANKTEIPPLFLAFWDYEPGLTAFSSDGSARTIQASGSVFTGRPWWISSTYDGVAAKTWLHVLTLHTDGHFRYYRSDDEGVSWSGVPFQATHDPNYVASGGNNEQRGLRSGYTPNLMISPNCQDLWMVLSYGEQNGPFTDYASNHIYRSLDHGVTWDKLSAGISGDHPFAKGMTRGAGGFLNAQSPGAVQLIFLDASHDEFILKRTKWYFEEFTYWRVNRTGTHASVIEEATDISIDERFYFNYFHAGGSSPMWGAGNLGTELACGYASGARGWQVLNRYYFMAPNRADFSESYGGYNCTNSWHSNGALLNPYARGGITEISITPSDATLTNICDEAGFIIRADHVNGLVKKLQQLQNTVIARGTQPADFGLEWGHMDHVTAGAGTTRGDHVRKKHYDDLRTEFEDKIKTSVVALPGGAFYTDGVDLSDDEYYIEPPIENIQDGPGGTPTEEAAVSIRTLIAMRKIIQALYTNGWFCACHTYCPCQTDITVTGEKK